MKQVNSEQHISSLGSHIPVLDGIRGWAVLLVIACHATTYVTLGNFGGNVGKAIVKVFSYGWIGVDLFFVLSGFLITGILIKKKEKLNYFTNFFAKRILRIFPLYYLVILVFLFFTPAAAKFFHKEISSEIGFSKIFLFLYLQNFMLSADNNELIYQIIRPTWSLAVEEHFYLVWPAIIYYVKNEKILKILLVLIVSAVFMRMIIAAGTHFSPYILRHWATFWSICRMDSILAGALLAVALVCPVKRVILEKWKFKLTAGLFALNAIFIFIKYVSFINFTLYALFFASIINLVLFLPKKHIFVKFFDNCLFRCFGKYSYCMYLFHIPIMLIIINIFKNILQKGLLGVSTLFIASTVSTWMFAWLSWHLYEKHFLNFKRYFGDDELPTKDPEKVSLLLQEQSFVYGNDLEKP